LINHYPSFPSPKILWDYENENPLLDIRGFEVEGERERPGPDYNRLLNKVLANGGRLYVDGAHPEYSTPECTTARGVVLDEKAAVSYQLSQRADFFETLMDLNTMVKRPIINTRDEPHADPAKYRRLHVIAGDVNMTEVATFLKVGAMSIVLDMIEDNWPLPAVELEDPVLAIKTVSRDLAVKGDLKLAGGRT